MIDPNLSFDSNNKMASSLEIALFSAVFAALRNLGYDDNGDDNNDESNRFGNLMLIYIYVINSTATIA